MNRATVDFIYFICKRYLECTLVFNGDYLSIPLGTGSCGYLFHEIPGMIPPSRPTPTPTTLLSQPHYTLPSNILNS